MKHPKSINNLINYGVKTINDSSPCPTQNTLIVIGVARGGTSMMAGILWNLKVEMHAARPPIYEDLPISRALEKDSPAEIESIIEQYNRSDQWAWKRPLAIEYLASIEQQLRNPRFIFVFRDVFAIANRNAISMDSETLPLMNKALQQYSRAVDFLSKTSSPCLICSSEKVLRYPQEIIRSVAQFSGLTPDAQTIENAVRSINPQSEAYLKSSRLNRSHGQIGSIQNNTIRGWATRWFKDEPAEVEIYIDDVLYTTVRADQFRPHLAAKNQTRAGYCGFSAELPTDKPGVSSTVRAKIKSDLIDLDKSPWTIYPANKKAS